MIDAAPSYRCVRYLRSDVVARAGLWAPGMRCARARTALCVAAVRRLPPSEDSGRTIEREVGIVQGRALALNATTVVLLFLC